MMNNIELIHGDCITEMNNIPDKSIDMILCDLPYGTTKCSWDIIIPFDKSLLEKPGEDVPDKQKELDFEKLIAENKALKDELTARRTEQQQTYVPKPLDLSEFKTRKI